jgi:hypothetical protein
MKALLLARYKAYSLALAHLKANETITSEVPKFATVYLSAKTALDEIEQAESRRSQKISGATEGKEKQRDDLARLAFSVASILVSYAVDKDDATLRAEMTFAPSELKFATPHELSSSAINILTSVKGREAELKEYGLTEADITSLTSQVEQFSTGKYAPRKFISERKQDGILVEENMARLTVIFNEQLDGLMLLFREKHPEFYKQYMIKRTVVQPGRRKTRMEGTITDSATGAELPGVNISIKGSVVSTVSEENGTYYLNMLPATFGIVVFEKEGYQTVELSAPIKRGQILHQDLAMKK